MALLLAAAGIVAGCRHQAPVVRHFLRMPAEAAGGLSSIQRARWLKENRRSLPDRKTLAATGHLVLGNTATKRGTVIRSLEVMHRAAETDGNGGLAVVTVADDSPAAPARLHLLTHRKFVYTDVSDEVPGRAGAVRSSWRVLPEQGCVTGPSGSPLIMWTGYKWVTGR